MTRRLMLIFVVSVVTLDVARLLAHDHFRVIGSITKHQNSTIDVMNKDSKTLTIRLDKQTEITRDKKKVDTSQLRVGQSVVVDAYGDSERDLLALEVRIVPPIRSTR
jgi:hypothetical protein